MITANKADYLLLTKNNKHQSKYYMCLLHVCKQDCNGCLEIEFNYKKYCRFDVKGREKVKKEK